VFLEHGGHHASGGFAVKDEYIFSLADKLNQAYEALGEEVTVTFEEEVDEVLLLDMVTHTLVEDIALLAPYGTGNKKPLFAFKNVTPRKVEQFGKAAEHLKLSFETTSGQLEAIAFFAKAEDFQKTPNAESSMTLLAHVERSYFMGRKQLRLKVVDVV
jgi:single-stranded-DNA-specific exonuclease